MNLWSDMMVWWRTGYAFFHLFPFCKKLGEESTRYGEPVRHPAGEVVKSISGVTFCPECQKAIVDIKAGGKGEGRLGGQTVVVYI